MLVSIKIDSAIL